MDGFVFLAAIVAAIIAVIVLSIGHRMHRQEMETGAPPRGSDLLLFALIGLGSALYFWGYDRPFWSDLMAILTGLLLGGGLAHFALRGLAALRKRRR